jgi:hypothetical protein
VHNGGHEGLKVMQTQKVATQTSNPASYGTRINALNRSNRVTLKVTE